MVEQGEVGGDRVSYGNVLAVRAEAGAIAIAWQGVTSCQGKGAVGMMEQGETGGDKVSYGNVLAVRAEAGATARA